MASSREEEIQQELDRLQDVLHSLDVDSEEWMQVAQERRELLLERIRIKPELKILLRPELEKEMEASVTEARSSGLMGKVYFTTDGRSYKRTGDHIILAHLYPALEREGFMDQRHLSGCFIVHNGVHGCTKQSPHVDFDMQRLQFPPSVPPLNVLVSLMDDTRLHLLNTVAREEVTVTIPKGDALVFDARIPHAGASYRYGRSHTRLFGFLPVKGMEDEWNNEEERRKGWLRMING